MAKPAKRQSKKFADTPKQKQRFHQLFLRAFGSAETRAKTTKSK